MRKIELLAPAKINLFLKILNKRRDGYHNIETVFEKVSLFDKITLKEESKGTISIKSNLKEMSLDKDNLIYKAADLIKKKFRIKTGLGVRLEKNIPIAGGLGGGSSDAAATLQGLNRLWRLGLSDKDLMDFASNIGSDVPLFIPKESFLLGKGRGNKISKIRGTANLKLWHILITSNFKVSTAYAYSLFDKYYLKKERRLRNSDFQGKLRLTIPNYSANIITYALFNRDVSLLNYYSYNSFESLILTQFPKLSKLKAIIEDLSGDFVHLSGSGPTLFITFSERKEAEYLIRRIKKTVKGCSCFLVSTF